MVSFAFERFPSRITGAVQTDMSNMTEDMQPHSGNDTICACCAWVLRLPVAAPAIAYSKSKDSKTSAALKVVIYQGQPGGAGVADEAALTSHLCLHPQFQLFSCDERLAWQAALSQH